MLTSRLRDWLPLASSCGTDNAGKPEGIHLMIGGRPYAAFGNSDGDREMLEYTGAEAKLECDQHEKRLEARSCLRRKRLMSGLALS